MEQHTAQVRRKGVAEGVARSTAQGFSLIAGAALVAVGVLGLLFADSSFSSGSSVDGGTFLFFEVNGWHNVLFLATGGVLILASATARSALTGLVTIGLIYAGVTVWGFIDGNDVANLIAVDDAANWVHLGLSAATLGVAAAGGALFAGSHTGDRHRRPMAHA